MYYLFNHDAVVAQYVIARVPEARLVPGAFTSLGITDNQHNLICGLVFFNWRPWDVELGIAADSPRWCTRGVLKTIFQYCFNSLGVERVTGMQAASNVRAHKLVEGVGFKLEGVLRMGWYGKEDAWIYGMLKSECPWLKEQGNEHRRREGGRQQAA